MKKLYVLLALIISTPLIAHAEDSRSLAMEFLEVSEYQKTHQAIIDQYVNNFSQGQLGMDRPQLQEFFERAMGWDVTKDSIVDVYAKHFSPDEIKAITAFYKTDAGKAFSKKTPLASQEIVNLITPKLQQSIAELQRNIKN